MGNDVLVRGGPRDETRVPPPHTWNFHFKSGSIAVDFISTKVSPFAREDGVERLTEPILLEEWLFLAGLPQPPEPLVPQDLERAVELREALYRLTAARVSKESFAAEDVGVLNGFAEPAPVGLSMSLDGRERVLPAQAPFAASLSTVARAAIEVYTGPYADRLKRCASEVCPLFFVDTSRQGNRRWCSMPGCGDRANARRYRERKRRLRQESPQ